MMVWNINHEPQPNHIIIENAYQDTDSIGYHQVQCKNDDLFYKICINDLQYVQGSNKKAPKSETLVTIMSFCSGNTSVWFNISVKRIH